MEDSIFKSFILIPRTCSSLNIFKYWYKEFITLLKAITDAKIEYGDTNGNIDYDRLSKEKQEEMTRTLMTMQPYFDKLNGEKSSKEVLTPGKYKVEFQ
ncbi:TPA: DUF3600 domain-containing protein [Bacillus pseudomycoides]|nr:DUF3600 domain-containing protein [Bacillus pseudomycoides]